MKTSSGTILVTGVNAAHFANLRVLIGSWLTHMRSLPLAVCDYGLAAEQVVELRRIAGVHVLPRPCSIRHPWQGKSLVGKFLKAFPQPWDNMVWIDADALFNHPLPELGPLLDGYDLLIDAHAQAVGEIVHDCNLATLNLRRDDAYFSAGWWVAARRENFLDRYEQLCALVEGKGNLWECDAFVAAVYAEKLRLRTVCGGIWHSRGKTSLPTCAVQNLKASHAGHPIYVVHANAAYTVRPGDQRRVFTRPELAAIQDHYEGIYWGNR